MSISGFNPNLKSGMASAFSQPVGKQQSVQPTPTVRPQFQPQGVLFQGAQRSQGAESPQAQLDAIAQKGSAFNAQKPSIVPGGFNGGQVGSRLQVFG